MRVLVGCEESGVVRDAFSALGHDAWSNDLQISRSGWKHLHMDVMDAIRFHGPWDLIILHPVCDAMALCGNKHYGKDAPKHQQRIDALSWTSWLWLTAKRHSPRVVMENPASVLFPHLKRKDPAVKVQYVQPYQFGHMEQKKTGLALYGVPPLVETNNVYDEMMKLPKNERERVFFMAPSPTRKRDRSTTYSGIANAMALQWGGDIRKERATMTDNYVEVEALAWKIYDDEKYGAKRWDDPMWSKMSDEAKRPYRVLARSALDIAEPTP